MPFVAPFRLTYQKRPVMAGDQDFTNVTEDMPVIIFTLESSTDDAGFVAQVVETVGWSYSSVVTLEVDLQPVPSAIAVKIEADIPVGAWVSLLEVRGREY